MKSKVKRGASLASYSTFFPSMEIMQSFNQSYPMMFDSVTALYQNSFGSLNTLINTLFASLTFGGAAVPTGLGATAAPAAGFDYGNLYYY